MGVWGAREGDADEIYAVKITSVNLIAKERQFCDQQPNFGIWDWSGRQEGVRGGGGGLRMGWGGGGEGNWGRGTSRPDK